jgi:DNA-binding HxlR family transcriptional regulator
VAVLSELWEKGRRYQDLDDAIDGISHKMLTDTLRRAERDGLIARHVDPGRVETATLYELTPLGRSLDAPIAALGDWVQANWYCSGGWCLCNAAVLAVERRCWPPSSPYAR